LHGDQFVDGVWGIGGHFHTLFDHLRVKIFLGVDGLTPPKAVTAVVRTGAAGRRVGGLGHGSGTAFPIQSLALLAFSRVHLRTTNHQSA
jgi:hypothetical protein